MSWRVCSPKIKSEKIYEAKGPLSRTIFYSISGGDGGVGGAIAAMGLSDGADTAASPTATASPTVPTPMACAPGKAARAASDNPSRVSG